MFIEGSKEYLEAFSSRLIETGEGPAFVVTLQNWHWEVFRFCDDNFLFKDNLWRVRGAWIDAQDHFKEYGTPLGETFNRSMAYAALLAAEAELDEIEGRANSMRSPGWEDEVIRRSTGGIMQTGIQVNVP